uniref:Uncharacterized protein n=1 Tax=Oryza punctata TaxID=4537 RepID=A0A0E0KNC6_ORYPU
MNSGDAEAAAASKKVRCNKEKKKKRKDDCGAGEASAADEEIVHDKKRKKQLQQKKNGDDLAVPNRKTTVVVFDSNPSVENSGDGVESGARFLVRILQYLETPQYLRRRLFPMHHNLKGCCPHSMHHTICASMSGLNFAKNVLVEQMLEPGKRVTVAMGTNRDITTACKRKIVSPSSPRDEMELYWGYNVRYASNLGGVFSDSPYKEGYDYIIGTSEHGKIISSSELILPSFRHLLIAFGGLAGLEECIEEDRNLKGKGVDDVFNTYLNTCPSQGSRTIRTENRDRKDSMVINMKILTGTKTFNTKFKTRMKVVKYLENALELDEIFVGVDNQHGIAVEGEPDEEVALQSRKIRSSRAEMLSKNLITCLPVQLTMKSIHWNSFTR